MWKIIEGLYLGTKEDSEDFDALSAKRIRYVLNCAAELPCPFEEEFEYLDLSLKDPDDGLGSQLATALAFIDRGRQQGAIMVHCSGGVSRSPAVVLAYLCHCGFGLNEAARLMRNAVQTRPNDVFLRQVCDYLALDVTDDGVTKLIHALSNSVHKGHDG